VRKLEIRPSEETVKAVMIGDGVCYNFSRFLSSNIIVVFVGAEPPRLSRDESERGTLYMRLSAEINFRN
jgi:hypothetical protein